MWLNICAFSHILGSLPHMTLQPIPSEFPYSLVYMKKIFFSFLSAC
jgi:hypothetical protein